MTARDLDIISPDEPSSEQLLKIAKENETLREQNKALESQVNYLQEQFKLFQKKKYGSSKETFICSDQLNLDAEFGLDTEMKSAPNVEMKIINESGQEVPLKKRRPKRTMIDGNCSRERVELNPDDIPEGAKLIGSETTERLKYIPGRYVVMQYVRNKYAIIDSEGNVKFYTANLPPTPIDKGIAESSVIANLITGKYCDHLPIYRQRQIIKRQNIDLPESTMLGWIKQTGDLLVPFYNYIRTEVLNSKYLQADETTIPVLTKDKPGATHKGYFWSYYAPKKCAIFFEYQPGRGALFPEDTLKDYQGVLQTDGYSVYNKLGHKEGIVHLACLAHVRRKFFDAQDNDKKKATYVLQKIQELYAIERFAKENEFSDRERYAIRQEKSVPILEEIEKWLFNPSLRFLPKSDIGKAIIYARNQWKKIECYAEDGAYLIDNNPIENKFRPIVVGRKNYLFAGSHSAAQRAAIFYTLIAMCNMAKVDPFSWLSDILNRMQDAKPSEFKSMMPENWKAPSIE